LNDRLRTERRGPMWAKLSPGFRRQWLKATYPFLAVAAAILIVCLVAIAVIVRTI
jgi:hypothetical protein